MWEPHHTWTDRKSIRVDGHIGPVGLDVSCFGDECCIYDDDDPDIIKETWDNGQVWLSEHSETHGAPTLIVPFDALTTEIIYEAIRRFNP